MTDTQQKELWAWYSAKMDERCGYVIYENQDGKKIVVTTISYTDKNPYHDSVTDVEFRGKVSKWVYTSRPIANRTRMTILLNDD